MFFPAILVKALVKKAALPTGNFKRSPHAAVHLWRSQSQCEHLCQSCADYNTSRQFFTPQILSGSPPEQRPPCRTGPTAQRSGSSPAAAPYPCARKGWPGPSAAALFRRRSTRKVRTPKRPEASHSARHPAKIFFLPQKTSYLWQPQPAPHTCPCPLPPQQWSPHEVSEPLPALKPEISFSRFFEAHLGHEGFSSPLLMSASNWCLHFLHLYSKIGMVLINGYIPL